jgi:hypothetical protein
VTRQQVISPLQLGRRVGAEVQALSQGNRAFLFVQPKGDPARAELASRDPFAEPDLRRKIANEDVIASYDVEYVELRAGWEAHSDDWDQFVYSRERFSCAKLEFLEVELRERWQLALAALQMPGDVDHPF